jgi:hypothetical protein
MAPVKPQVPANILEGAQKYGWSNPALKNISFGTGFNQPPTGTPAPNKYDEIIEANKKAKAAGLPVGDVSTALVLASLSPQQNFEDTKKVLDYNAQLKRDEADYRQKLGEESTKKALLYTSLGNLGNQIATGIGGTPEQWKQMYNIPTVYNDTLRSFPQATITPSATSAIGQRNYFG